MADVSVLVPIPPSSVRVDLGKVADYMPSSVLADMRALSIQGDYDDVAAMLRTMQMSLDQLVNPPAE